MSETRNESILAIELMSHVDENLYRMLSESLDRIINYDEGLINILYTQDGRFYCTNVNNVGDTLYQKFEFVKSKRGDATFKVSGLESEERILPLKEVLGEVEGFDCHLFMNFCRDAPSFDTHFDDKNVVLLMLKGLKIVEIEDRKPVTLTPGKCVSIPKGHWHKVKTLEPSMALSLGYL